MLNVSNIEQMRKDIDKENMRDVVILFFSTTWDYLF